MGGRHLKSRGIDSQGASEKCTKLKKKKNKKLQVPQSECEGICLCDLEKRSFPQFPSGEHNLNSRQIIQSKGSYYFSESYDRLYLFIFSYNQISRSGCERAYP